MPSKDQEEQPVDQGGRETSSLNCCQTVRSLVHFTRVHELPDSSSRCPCVNYVTQARDSFLLKWDLIYPVSVVMIKEHVEKCLLGCYSNQAPCHSIFTDSFSLSFIIAP